MAFNKTQRLPFNLTCFGLHCRLSSESCRHAAVMCLSQLVFGVDHVTCHAWLTSSTAWQALKEGVPGGKAPSFPADGVCIPFSYLYALLYPCHLWPTEAIVTFSPAIIWFSRLQGSEIADLKLSCFAFSFSPGVTRVAVCFSTS